EVGAGLLDLPPGPFEDPAQRVGVEVGHVRIDDLPARGGQVVTGVRDLDVAVDRPAARLLTQVHQELVRVGQVLEPVPAGEHVVLGQGFPAWSVRGVKDRAGRVRSGDSGVHGVVAHTLAAGVRAQLPQELTLPTADV